MIKFLYMTDPHAKGSSPSTRTDDFPSTIERKIENFFETGHEQNVDFFVVGGDFVDTPYITPRYAQRLGKLYWKGAQGKEIFFVWGNHDMVAWNPNTIDNTTFGLFEAFNDNMTLLSATPITREYNGISVQLTGVASYAKLDRHMLDEEGNISQHRSRDYVVNETSGIPHIHVVHGYLSPKPILDDIPHTVIEEMRHTKATITLTGHEHTGFPVTKIDNGLVYNPGALGRVFASHTEMNRMPKYALCSIDRNHQPDIQPIQCPIARLGADVMDRSALDAKKLQEQMFMEAKGNIQDVLKTVNIERVDLRTIITRFKDEVEPDVYAEVNRRLQL